MTYPATQTYWLERTDQVAVGLRRYHRPAGAGWSCAAGYHSALVYTDTAAVIWRDTAYGPVLGSQRATPRDDPRWPTHCRCGYAFTVDDEWQDWQELLYRRTDTGEQVTLRARDDDATGGPTPAPPGAMWDAWWMGDSWRGPDGIALMVRLPDGHDWHVDGEATNCNRKGDRGHKCWIRHGHPQAANLTVDKNGDTCTAGAGSIASAKYHGFLINGVLTAG